MGAAGEEPIDRGREAGGEVEQRAKGVHGNLRVTLTRASRASGQSESASSRSYNLRQEGRAEE